MSCLAIIPARGGSKRIPRKNIKVFLGKPIISYSIEAAIQSNLFDEVMVSTEDEEIANLAKSLGAKIPFLRSAENASDNASTFDVVKEVINDYKEIKNSAFENICCIYPCTPLIKATNLIKAFEKMQCESLDSVLPVIPYEFPIQKAISINGLRLSVVFPQYENKRTQDLENTFHDAGQFYFFKSEKLSGKKSFISKKTGAIILSILEAQDINNETDWKIAEIKYEILQNS